MKRSEEARTEHRDLLAEYASLYDNHFEQNEELESLRQEIGTLKAAHGDINTALFDAQQRLVALQVEHVSLIRAKDEADITVKAAKEELNFAQKSIEQLQHQLTEAESEKQNILAAHGQTESSHFSLEEKLESVTLELQVHQENNESLQSLLTKWSARRSVHVHRLQVEINQEQAQAVAEYQDTIQVLETER